MQKSLSLKNQGFCSIVIMKNDLWLKWLRTTSFRLLELLSSRGKMIRKRWENLNNKRELRNKNENQKIINLETWHIKVRPDTDNNYARYLDKIQHSFLQTFILLIYFATHASYSNLLIAFSSFILPVEDCSSGSWKLVAFDNFSQRSFLIITMVHPGCGP